jgi:hypothetical protein
MDLKVTTQPGMPASVSLVRLQIDNLLLTTTLVNHASQTAPTKSEDPKTFRDLSAAPLSALTSPSKCGDQ